MKKILVISPIPTHPQNTGSRARVYALLNTLQELGHEIHFFYCQMDDTEEYVVTKSDTEAMRRAWDRFFLFKPEMKEEIPERFREGEVMRERTDIDFQYPAGLDYYIKQFCGKTNHDAVLTVYVTSSKALELFPDNVLKVIDAQDVFTDRARKIGEDKWFSTTAEEEARGLNRAHVIIAIQEREAEFFRSIVGERTRVVTIGHKVKVARPRPREKLQRTLLFVGGGTLPNIDGLRFFIGKVLPRLKRVMPDAELKIAGGICKFIPNSRTYVKLGEIGDLDDAYRRAGVVIAPLFLGTGLKIKVIEALGYGKTVVGTSHAAEGLGDIAEQENTPLLVADTPEAFVERIEIALRDGKYDKRAEKAEQFVRAYNENVENELRKLFPPHDALLVTLADRNFIPQAKQLFSSVYWNAGWQGDYMLLAHDIPEEDLRWFREKGILVKKCAILYEEKRIGRYFSILSDKLHLFTPEFKRWKHIVYLDADFIVRASLDKLARRRGFWAVADMGKPKLAENVTEEGIRNRILDNYFNIHRASFNAGLFAFSTDIIDNETFYRLVKLFDGYSCISKYGDQLIFNLFFYDTWRKLPFVYDVYPMGLINTYGVKPEEHDAIGLHFVRGESEALRCWDERNPFYAEWKRNLDRAEGIDLHNIPKGKRWSMLKIVVRSARLRLYHG